MTWSRRRFLGGVIFGGLGSGGARAAELSAAVIRPLWAGGLLQACGSDIDETRLAQASGRRVEPWPAAEAGPPFNHGVASGDPLSGSVVLWTRVTPDDPALSSIDVQWRIALDAAFEWVVHQGSARAEASADFTLHVEVDQLAENTTYYYQFFGLERTSPIGRTKTLPLASIERMRIGVASCSNYPGGYFNAYGAMARADLDLVLHLGDYIYEFGNGTFGDGTHAGRVPEPPYEAVTLDDYRARHAQYKTDPDLQELHRQHPMIGIWDDHEAANDAFRDGAQNHQASEGEYAARKTSAQRAYREWMPLRAVSEAKLYRAFACGDLFDLVMLDTRFEGRDAQGRACDVASFTDPARQLLGAEQERWLRERLSSSQRRGARWRIIGQQVMLAPLQRSIGGCVQSPDSWDGYAAARARLFDALSELGIDNVIVLTGDSHASWALDVPADPFSAGYDPTTGDGSLLVEIAAPAVSSAAARGDEAQILRNHPHVKFTDQTRNGYVLIDVSRERAQAEWHYVGTVSERRSDAEVGAVFRTLAGTSHLVPGEAPSSPRADAPSLAP